MILFITVPVRMLSENWDDHNRSNRFIARNLAIDYLRSCDRNAILFTYGDNDTFPLWYIQETEGFRTDVRVVNINYLATSWGINQLRLKQHNSEPIALMGSVEFYTRNQAKTFPLIFSQGSKGFLDRSVRASFSEYGNRRGSLGVPFTLSLSSEGVSIPILGGSSDSCNAISAIWKVNKSSLRIGD